MTIIDFAKENRQEVINNCPKGVELSRFMSEFIIKFDKISSDYGFIGFPPFYDAISDVIDTIRTDVEIAGLNANNFLREHNAEASRKMYYEK